MFILKFLGDLPQAAYQTVSKINCNLWENVLSADATIAPLGTRSTDYEWREALLPGTRVDCLNTQLGWFPSTIIDFR